MRLVKHIQQLSHKITSKRRFWNTFLVTVLMAGFTLGFSGLSDSDFFLKIHRSIDIFGKVYKEIATNYVDEIDPDRFMRAGIDGMMKTLDPYTVYLGEKESDEIDLVTMGKYGGIGITVGLRDGILTVISPIEGFSASKQGIEVGDRILEVDGKNVAGRSPIDVRMLVRGAPGTTVRMKVEREGQLGPLEFVLIREEIPIQNITYVGYVADGIGYVKLEKFSRTAGDDLRNSIKELRAKAELRGLVLDLRENPGGLLDVAVDVASKFLPESSFVVSTRGRRSDSDRKYYSTEKPMVPDVPLAVMVDRGTASASEIVAGAVQDLDRGIIVGTRTFGKGLVQTITRISENTSLKITTARYYTPSGRSIQEIDYFRRTTDGDVRNMSDTLRRAYQTTHHRKVSEGSGIVPDTTVSEEEPSKFVQELTRKAMFFKYANHLATKRKELPEGFIVTDDVLKDFEAFTKERGFRFVEESELKLNELREYASRSHYGKSFDEGLARLEELIKAEKERAFERSIEELRWALKLEILGRFKGEKARIKASFERDTQLMVATNLLTNKTAYSRLLTSRSK